MMNNSRYGGQMAPKRTRGIFRAKQIIWYILGLLEVILAFRFFLKLTSANQAAGFTRLIYDISEPFVAPFMTVFKITRVEGGVFEWTTILAMIVYWIIVMGILKLIVMGKPISTEEADRKITDR